jgi:molecular chaperone DnaK (HSP70)
VESKNRLEALVYQIETMMTEQKDKIPAEEQDTINKLITDGKSLKDKEEVTKEEIDQEIERIEKEFQTLYQKYQAAPSGATPNPNEELDK